MKMHVGGAWVDAAETIDVLNPFDGSVVDTVPRATTGRRADRARHRSEGQPNRWRP